MVLLDEMHSKKPPYIPRIDKTVDQNPLPKLPELQPIPKTGLGDLGMKTAFNVAPVGKTPVISRGMPVGYPKTERP